MATSSPARGPETRPRLSPGTAGATVGALLARRDAPALVPGTVVVAFLLAFSRWGSYLGVPSRTVFVTDLLLLGSLSWTIVRYGSTVTGGRSWRRALGRAAVLRLAPLLMLGAWALLRSLAGPFTGDAVRDLAPYGYILVMGLAALVPVEAQAWRRSLRVLAGAGLVHLLWVTISTVLGDTLVLKMPLLGGVIRVFEIRPDYDGAVIAMLVGCLLMQASLLAERRRGRAAAACAALAFVASGVVLLLANRAGLLALVVAYGVVAATLVPRAMQVWRAHPRAVVAAAVVLLAAAALIVPQTPLYARITGVGGFSQGNASGTADARKQAWSAILRYIGDEPARVAVGVGTGPDFLKDSGASVHYQAVGHKIVRQPHDFPINTYARLGVVGLALLGWLLVALVVASWRKVRSPRSNVEDIGLVLMWSTLFVAALVGVVLEAPFGAIPFGWAAGRLLLGGAARRDLTRERPASVPAGVRRA